MNTNYQDGHDPSKEAAKTAVMNSGRDITEGAQQQLVEIGTHIEEMLNEESKYVDEDIHRIGHLIHDAMSLLQESFNHVMVKTNKQCELLVELEGCLEDSELAEKNENSPVDADVLLSNLTESSALIKDEINNSIRALQFEDIARQLTEHIQKRLGHINEIALVAHTEISGVSTEDELKGVASRLHTMRDDFRKMNIADIVKQQDMSEGDIELF